MQKIDTTCPGCGRPIRIHPLASYHECEWPDCGYWITSDELEEIFLEEDC